MLIQHFNNTNLRFIFQQTKRDGFFIKKRNENYCFVFQSCQKATKSFVSASSPNFDRNCLARNIPIAYLCNVLLQQANVEAQSKQCESRMVAIVGLYANDAHRHAPHPLRFRHFHHHCLLPGLRPPHSSQRTLPGLSAQFALLCALPAAQHTLPAACHYNACDGAHADTHHPQQSPLKMLAAC